MRGPGRMSADDVSRPDATGAPAALMPRRTAGPDSVPTRAAVLILHGGTADSKAPSRRWNVAGVRMRPFVRAVARALPDEDTFVGQVRYRHRGWNGADADPLADVLRALAELADLVGEVPVVLVGHSMGGRAALRAAAAPQVRAVVALAPWCPEGEPVAHLRDKRVIVLHGDRDRVTGPAESFALVRRAAEAGSSASAVRVEGGDHAMLRRARTWHRVTGATVADLVSRIDAGPDLLSVERPGGEPDVL
ncbi:alpha/beta hydrolase [Streptomyces rhizosphaerihabitans]|uniref:alpha/beta hydrolase n=1 Tax=Streptomyces rhizosphaerihabitans TaxID=1266770 RepID=UPI0028F6DC74|nr:alpha/beta fold hydrolase [Streptomyces rhizosphaerihabitans]